MFELPSQYAYLFLCLPFLLVWGALFLLSRPTRFEQLHFSYIGAVAGPLSEIIYFRDYWIPKSVLSIQIGSFPLLIEDVLFGLAIGGIGAVIFEALIRCHLKKLSRSAKHSITSGGIIFIFVIALSALLHLGLNSIYASAGAFIIAGIPVVFYRHDLLVDAIGSGIAVMLTMFLCYLIVFNLASNAEALMSEQWLIHGTVLDLRVAGIPLTEMAWGFTWGFIAGPLYEFLNNKRISR